MSNSSFEIEADKQIFYPEKPEYNNCKMFVKISKNFNKIVMALGKDCYELSERNGEYN